MKILVMKFGGSSVASAKSFSRVADLILEKKQEGYHIASVVSAMGDTTNTLINLAHEVNPTPPRREYDMLVSAGERISISLLAMALAKKEEEAISFTGSQSGIITTDDHSDAEIIDVRPRRILEVLKQNKIAIVAGFQGVSESHEITTLGRGGSDTTAVALGVALKAERVEFYKDVPGVYKENPKHYPDSELYEKMTYKEACELVKNGSPFLHLRSLLLAEKNHLPLFLRSYQVDLSHIPGTIISDINKCSSNLVV